MSYIYYDDKNNVKMVSSQPIDCDLNEAVIEQAVEVSPTYTVKYIEGNIVYEDTAETTQTKEIVQGMQNVTDINELKALILKLI